MSMISEQVNLLRSAVIRLRALDLPHTANEVKEAADTIEELSTKLANANMERSTAYYNDGWIPCSERLPEEDVDVLLCIKDAEGNFYQTVTYFHIIWQTEVGGIYSLPVAWKPLPEPYKPEGE